MALYQVSNIAVADLRLDREIDAEIVELQVQNPIDLPQITVVGSQSSGKSSVLENIVGRDLYDNSVHSRCAVMAGERMD